MTDDRIPDALNPTPPRRRLLVDLLAAFAVAVAIFAWLGGPRSVQGTPGRASLAERMLAVADTDSLPDLVITDTLRDPIIVRSYNGVLEATLDVDTATLPVPQSDSTHHWKLRTYSLAATTDPTVPDSVLGRPRFPGPTFLVKPGDSVRILLRNKLPKGGNNTDCINYPARNTLPPRDTAPDCFHGSNWTNIHYHGFHVTPDSSSKSVGDDVLMAIAPGTSVQYAFRVPQNQSPGTHWYHPHKHGSVALQVANGMSGAFFVEGGTLDNTLKALRMRERLLAVQQIDTSVNLLQQQSTGTATMLINGQYQPVITMRPGEVQRWRIVNENVQGTTTHSIFFPSSGSAGPIMYDFARDGVQFDPKNYTGTPDDTLLLAPGNRLDVFVVAPKSPGVHELHSVVVENVRPSHQRQRARRDRPVRLLTVHVREDRTDGYIGSVPNLPNLPGFLQNLPGPIDTADLDTVQRMPVVVFADDTGSVKSLTRPTLFFLGNQQTPYMQFDPNTVYTPTDSLGNSHKMILGNVQTWKVVNTSQQNINHPFHIHINPFQVLYVSYDSTVDAENAVLYKQLNTAAQTNGKPIWLDVIPLPAPHSTGKPGYVIIRQQYADFTGQYVMHCHILGHEERGMMQLLRVDSASKNSPQRRPIRKDPQPQQHHH